MNESSKSKFPTMGTSAGTTARNASAEGTTGGKLMKKKGAQAADPYKQPLNKKGTTKAGKRAYGITARMPAYKDPSIGATQGNGRLFTAAINRTAPNFSAGYSNLD